MIDAVTAEPPRCAACEELEREARAAFAKGYRQGLLAALNRVKNFVGQTTENVQQDGGG